MINYSALLSFAVASSFHLDFIDKGNISVLVYTNEGGKVCKLELSKEDIQKRRKQIKEWLSYASSTAAETCPPTRLSKES